MAVTAEIEYDMTTIARRQQQYRDGRKWPWIMLAIIMIGIAAFFVFSPSNTSGQIRGDSNNNNNNKDAAVEKDTTDQQDMEPQEISSGGREITFELSYLDGEEGDAHSDKIVIRTRPEWAPLGVEQFHVSLTC